jgi:hypothetical protein
MLLIVLKPLQMFCIVNLSKGINLLPPKLLKNVK